MARTTALITVLCFLFTGFAEITFAAETTRQREQRQAIVKQFEIRISEINQKLNSVAGKSSTVKEQSREEFARLKDELARKQEAATRKMAELRSATPYDWERLKAETNSAIDDLNRTYDRISSLFGNI